ncbi:YdeI/OmpD-associated family protein [Algoriphagus sp.]|uniref:YdeI/OmpD-associated family protein n=1 Tax=Algoriphagus sp. TaxID=1872435 RepID=UPI003F6F3B43
MKMTLNPKVDKYLIDGCMRCKYGGTPQCKVNNWKEELELLRQLVLETGLTEELKWGVPVYTHKGKNILTVAALKGSANIGFFKGALLTDKRKILQQQGNLQSDRIVRFTDTTEIQRLKNILQEYVLEAIQIEVSGKKVVFKRNPEPIPEELLQAFEDDPAFQQAFYALTPGKQRGYIIYFSQPKQALTRTGRIEKCKEQIFSGSGLHDKYGK